MNYPTENLSPAIRDAAWDAIAMQDACNLAGVLQSIQAARAAILQAHPEEGTAWKNRHPVLYLMLYKALALAGTEALADGWEAWQRAFQWCDSVAGTNRAAPKGWESVSA